MKEFFKGFVFYFINHVLNKVPSRRFRIFFYHFLSGKKISRKATIGLGVRILDIRGVEIGGYTNVNFDSILDGRGEGIVIGKNVDIAPQVNIWSLGHDPKSPEHTTVSKKVIVEEGCWLANRVIVLPGTHLKRNTTVAAGSLVHGEYEICSILKSKKAERYAVSFSSDRKLLRRTRCFR